MESGEILNLSNPQKSIWITEQYYKGSALNNICGTAIIQEKVDFEKLETAILKVLEKNEIFKIKLKMEENTIKQIAGEEVNKNIVYFEVKNYDELENIRKNIVSKPMTLLNSFLYNFYIFKMPKNRGAFMLNIHHIFADSWTLGLISKQIIEVYSGLVKNEKTEKMNEYEKVYQYSEYIKNEEEYTKSLRYEKDKEYWEKKFETIPEIANINTVKDEIIDTNSFKGARQLYEIDAKLLKKIKSYCEKNNISLYNFFMAIFSVYISGVSSLTDFVVGTPILNRTNFKEKHTAGMFVATQPLRINVSNDATFKTLTKEIARDILDMLRHQRYPYQQLLEHLREENKSVPNLYNILISYQITNAQNKDEKIDYITDWTFNGNCADNLDIQIFDLNDSNKLNISYDYKTAVFGKTEIEELHNRILYILNQVLETENIKLKDIEIVTPDEKEELLNSFNQTDLKYNENKPIIKYFEDQAKKRPMQEAMVFKKKSITYKELNEKANSLAHLLRDEGVTNNTIVGIMQDRSFEMMIAIVAVLKAGGAYIPIAPDYPSNRIGYMLSNSRAKILLADKKTSEDLNFTGKIIDIKESEIYSKNKENLKNNSKPEDLSYVIYTSGSTGQPKGVMLTQKNLSNFYAAMVKNIKYLSFKNQPKIISITTLSFDIFIFETLISLTRGLKLYITDYYEQKITSKLERIIKENNIEIMQTTPSVMKFHLENLSDERNFASLKYIMLAGEQLPKSLVEEIKRICPNCTIYNGYGPSETTIFSATANVTNLDKITIGRPIANTQIYVLNANQKLLPKNFMGEMYIAGDGVGKGYLYRKDLTSQKFIDNFFKKDGRMYASGDLGIWRDNKTLECKGRIDHQIKLNGLRIELGEIEERINLFKTDNLLKSAVIVKTVAGKDTLNAFISYPAEIDVLELKKYLLNYLPNYMIPNTFTILEEMPFTANGKIDRKALEKYKVDKAPIDKDYSKPRNEIEEILLNTIKQKLNVEDFGIDSNIFDFGADSLTIINIITELFRYHFNLKVFDIYKYPTVREIYDNLLHKNINRSTIDYEKFENLNKSVNSFSKEIEAKAINKKYDVFLTGATGFLGSHILAELLEDQNHVKNIYCAMRPKGNISSEERLLKKLKFYFGEKYILAFKKHVKIVECDITKEKLGLSDRKYRKLQSKIDIAIHTAANVKHYGKYSSLEKVNVVGTQNIIDFCKDKKIPLHYISTMTVSGNYLLEQKKNFKNFNENSFYIEQNFDENVYSKSKLIAESLIIEAIQHGLVATIYRIGDLTGRYEDGVFQENIKENAIYLRLKSILEIGYLPDTILKNDLEFTPVDYAAKAVKLIIWSNKNKNRIFNIFNPKMITTEKLLEFLKDKDYNIEILSKEKFNEKIEELSAKEENQEKLLGIINDFTNDKDLVYNYTIKQNNDITCKYLKNLGFKWKNIDNAYLTKILNYMKQVRFIKD